MLKDIYLKNVYTEEDMNEIWNLMEKEEGLQEIFHAKQDRISSSVVACLIRKKEKTIGFFMLTVEDLDNVLFLDIGITKEYRNKGIGKSICEEIINQNLTNKFIISETKNDNINDLNYYLLNKKRVQEFLESSTYNQFIKYCNSDKPKQYEYIKKLRDTNKSS